MSDEEDYSFVTYRQLREIYGIPYCMAHLLRLEKLGKFPRREKLRPEKRHSRVVWWKWEIKRWIASWRQ